MCLNVVLEHGAAVREGSVKAWQIKECKIRAELTLALSSTAAFAGEPGERG